jgi:hypothetical protein
MSKLVLQPSTLITPEIGTLEYDGGELYFTPLGTQRGIVPSMQYYRLNSDLAGTQATTPQAAFDVGVTVSSNTVYAFEAYYPMFKTAGTTSHAISSLFGGTATINNIGYVTQGGGSSAVGVTFTTEIAAGFRYIRSASAQIIGGPGYNGTSAIQHLKYSGTVSINAGGTFIPQYQLSAAPGGVWTMASGAYFLIYPIGAAGSNTSVGTWA